MDNWEPPKWVWPKTTADDATEAAMSDNRERAAAYFTKYCSPFASKSDATEELRALLAEAERRGLERAAALVECYRHRCDEADELATAIRALAP